MPSARAVATEQSTSPAAWSTFHFEQWSFPYGKASIGLRLASAIASALDGLAEPSVWIAAAIVANPPERRELRRCAASEMPSAARSAFSIIAYWVTGIARPARSSASLRIFACGRSTLSGVRRRLLRERRIEPGCACALRAMPGLPARHEHDVGAPGRDVGRRAPEQRRLEHAELGHLGARARRAEALREQPTRIGVGPEAARRADRVGAREQCAAARVLRCALEGRGHQRERLARRAGSASRWLTAPTPTRTGVRESSATRAQRSAPRRPATIADARGCTGDRA